MTAKQNQIQSTNKAVNAIDYYLENRQNPTFNEEFIDLCIIVGVAIHYWSAYTYVGVPKSETIKNQYQKFYMKLKEMVDFMDNAELVLTREELDFLKSIKYNGAIYRYLGVPDSQQKHDKIKPYFNNIYVSWSKERENSYIESKLYGIVTKMRCITNITYGFDLEEFENYLVRWDGSEWQKQLSRANEREVVYPTIKSDITNVFYSDEDGYFYDEN